MTKVAIQKMAEAMPRIQQAQQQIFDAANHVLSALPAQFAWLVEPVLAGLNKLAQVAREFTAFMSRIIQNPGDPEALDWASEVWHHQVAMPATRLAGTVSLGDLAADNQWRGNTAHEYETAVVPRQAGAVESVQEIAGQVSGSLTYMAGYVRTFHVAIVSVAATLLIGVVAAIPLVYGTVSAPAGIAVAAAAFTAALGTATVAYNGIVGIVVGMNNQYHGLSNGLDKIGKTWQRPSTDLSTGWVPNDDN